MAAGEQEYRQNEAIGWRVRLRDGGEAEWEAFVRWLEEDPRHSLAYDEVAHADTEIAPDMVPSVSPPPRQAPILRWAPAWAAAAALLVLALATVAWLSAGPSRYAVATGPGEQKVVTIADGGSIALNGATRVILDRNDPRFAELAAGEATFTLRHDPRRPFELVAGRHRLRDAGTIFNVVHEERRFAVDVIEGALVYNPDAEAIPLGAGQALAVRTGSRPVLARADPRAMAGWRRGQLSYREASLDLVASDLSRSLGVRVEMAPTLAARLFTGSIRVEESDDATVAALAATLGAEARRQDGGWLIGAGAHAPR